MADIPTEEQVVEYFTALSNWGRWGPDDQLGTLNLVTPEKRKAAAALVTEGVTISCAWDIETTPQPDQVFGPPQRYMVASGEGLHDPDRVQPPMGGARLAWAMEYFGLVFHGLSITHLDGLSHVFWDKQMYNGQPAAKVTTSGGALHEAITVLRDGVMTRGVLLDVAAAEKREWLTGGEGVTPAQLEAAEARQGVRVEPGDAVLLRTGYGRQKRQQGRGSVAYEPFPGWHAAALPWLHERGAAMIGCDTAQDMNPSPYPNMPLPVHAVGIVAMGLWLIDNMNLEELAATCEELQRWEFQFVLAPLRITGGTGSPANPLAVL